MLSKCMKWTVIALAMTLLANASAYAEEFHGRFTGISFTTAVDTNGDGNSSVTAHALGNFSQLGRVTALGYIEGYPWDGASFCSPTEILAYTHSLIMTFTISNGDTLIAKMSDSVVPPSIMCLDFFTGEFEQAFHMDFHGGTGRFAEATGSYFCEMDGKTINTPLGATVGFYYEANCHGDLYLD